MLGVFIDPPTHTHPPQAAGVGVGDWLDRDLQKPAAGLGRGLLHQNMDQQAPTVGLGFYPALQNTPHLPRALSPGNLSPGHLGPTQALLSQLPAPGKHPKRQRLMLPARAEGAGCAEGLAPRPAHLRRPVVGPRRSLFFCGDSGQRKG